MGQRAICKAFGNEERLRMILCLSRPQSVSELIGHCPRLSQSAVSQHLKILREARVVSSHREGKQVVYRIRDKKAAGIAKLLLHYK